MTEQDTAWDTFLQRATALFDGVDDRSAIDDELFIHQLAAFAAPLEEVPWVPTGSNAGLGDGIRTGPIQTGRRRGFFVLRWEFAPGAVLPPHDHPNYSFATFCVEGEMHITNFELQGAAPAYDSKEAFVVRRTQEQLVARGRINTLTRTRDNIHTLRAGPDGAVGMDIGILHAADVGFSYLDIADEGDARGAFDARWDRALTKRVRGR